MIITPSKRHHPHHRPYDDEQHHAPFRLQTSPSSDQSAEAASYCFPNTIPASDDDKRVLQHQTGQVGPSVAAIGVPAACQCQHGYPQVFLLNPLSPDQRRMNSGLLKLTCPLLVNAIDQLEDDGYIANFTSQVQANEEWKESCQARHETHAVARRAILLSRANDSNSSPSSSSSFDISILQQKLGEKGSAAFLDSGIAGATVGKPDVKCLHAWMGDYLFHIAGNDDKDSRGHDHFLGEAIAAALQERNNISLSGTLDCHQYCNPDYFSITGGVTVPKARNKQRLKTQKEKDRRKRKKEREQAEAALLGDDHSE
ncbi:unnamed protein product [Cylindrotheca closterium]|uniref:Uncharacterized protein n=1 Tax=Cylindrotheca closterium TaxID=2856 RepID=A0AAD2CGX9_9STRA|nr:unnamed protein product [Cylindrotheca closterium]